MRLQFCGVRGSTPAPGAEFVRTGGHTSCVSVTPAGADRPSLVLDAGTGLRNVTALVAPGPFVGTIVLTHLHWDHVQGIPFFAAGDRDDAVVRVLAPDNGAPAVETIAAAMSPPHFPIGPDGLRGRWSFETIGPGAFTVDGIVVEAAEVPHKGGRTFGYRLTDTAEGGSASMAYVPDHLPASSGRERDRVIGLVSGVDVLVHGGHFTAAERERADAYGHGVVDDVIALAVEARVGRLVLTHHAPGRTDEEIDAIAAAVASAEVEVTIAREGEGLTIG